MGFGICEIHCGNFEVDVEKERAKFQFDLEFCSVYSKHQIQAVNQMLKKITLDDMIEVFNKVGKRKLK